MFLKKKRSKTRTTSDIYRGGYIEQRKSAEDYEGFSDIEDDDGIAHSIMRRSVATSLRPNTNRRFVSVLLTDTKPLRTLTRTANAALLDSDSSSDEEDSMDGRGKMGRRRKLESSLSMKFMEEMQNPQSTTLAQLLGHAQTEIAMHNAAINTSESERVARELRQSELDAVIKELTAQARHILATAQNAVKSKSSMSQEYESIIANWEKALHLYVQVSNEQIDKLSLEKKFDAMTLLEMLVDGCQDESTLKDALELASSKTYQLVNTTRNAANDSEDDIEEAEVEYRIKLKAHSVFLAGIEDDMAFLFKRFRADGTAAVTIGRQLEDAEGKRRQCESTCTLIKRWWSMEELARMNKAEPIDVESEISGKTPHNECKLDPLFTLSENSLEAAHALKALRTVVQSSSINSVIDGSNKAGNNITIKVKERFEITSKLIDRVSIALESRLLTSFLYIFQQGGTYDFSTQTSKQGRLNWQSLRELAEGLFCFNGGQKVQNAYVNQVVTTRFPEFSRAENANSGVESFVSGANNDSEMDSTRSKLSGLFHRVAEVCSAEFALIAHVFNFHEYKMVGGDLDGIKESAGTATSAETRPLQVARLLLHRIISDNNRGGLQTCINGLLANIKGESAFDIGTKKLDTFVVIHEKVNGLFTQLEESMRKYLIKPHISDEHDHPSVKKMSMASSALLHFLNSQALSLSKGQRQGYFNLELRLLHHECCSSLEQAGARLIRPSSSRNPPETSPEYKAPILSLNKDIYLTADGRQALMEGILKPNVLRQPLIHATDSLARTNLMFGAGGAHTLVDHESRSRAIFVIFDQMTKFYGNVYLFSIMDLLEKIICTTAPGHAPDLGRGNDSDRPHDLGVEQGFWLALDRIHTAANAFDRELWAENKVGSSRVWDLLIKTGNHANFAAAKESRYMLFRGIEERGETCIFKALDAVSNHVEWIIVGGEAGTKKGPYALPSSSALTDSTSPSIQYVTKSLRHQFVHIQSALSKPSLARFWTAVSMRLFDCIVARLLLHYQVTINGSVMLSRDIDSLHGVSLLAGSNHSHWDMLREVITLYMTPPDNMKSILMGPDGDMRSSKGLLYLVGQEKALVFLSRRWDYREKGSIGTKKSDWVFELFRKLELKDPTDVKIDVTIYSAENWRKSAYPAS